MSARNVSCRLQEKQCAAVRLLRDSAQTPFFFTDRPWEDLEYLASQNQSSSEVATVQGRIRGQRRMHKLMRYRLWTASRPLRYTSLIYSIRARTSRIVDVSSQVTSVGISPNDPNTSQSRAPKRYRSSVDILSVTKQHGCERLNMPYQVCHDSSSDIAE